MVNGDVRAQRGGAKELHRRGLVPQERQNTGPEPQLVIW